MKAMQWGVMDDATSRRADELFCEQRRAVCRATDRLFVPVLFIQWLAAVGLAFWSSPRTWLGTASFVHPHVWEAVIWGAAINALPCLAAARRPGHLSTRLTIAVAQALNSALLIHLSDGRLESHFHVFSSLALLAFYRDWRVLVLNSVLIGLDHSIRGVWWPLSIYGTPVSQPWRFVEHGIWVAVEDVFLLLFCRQSLREMHRAASREARLERSHEIVEAEVVQRTQALKESEERYALAARGTQDGLCDWSLLTHDAYFSPRVREMLGLSERELPDNFDALCSRIHPEDADRAMSELQQGIVEDRPNSVEFRMLTQSGEYRWFQGRGNAIRDPAGTPFRFVGSLTDITPRKHAEEALRASLEEFRAMFERSAVGEVQIDPVTGRYLRVNQKFCKMLGYSAAELLGRCSADLTHPDDMASVQQLDRLMQGTIDQFSLEKRYLRKDGSSIWCHVTSMVIRDMHNRPHYITSAIEDVTERKQIESELFNREEQLRRSQRLEAVGCLAGGVAHEFNNLLQVMLGYARFAWDVLPPDADCRKDLEQVIDAGEQAARLTRQLLSFSRQQVLQAASIDPGELVGSLAKLLRPLIGEHIELQTALADDVGQVHADPALLEQMLMNLSINARDAMPAGGQLLLKVERATLSEKYCELHPPAKPGNYVLFSVTDTGHGMSAAVKSRIFDPFYTTKEVGKGTGLGLAMVYGAVQQHGGHINVYSEVGRGTTFRIYLPDSAPQAPEIAKAAAATPRGGAETILIAEDEPMVLGVAVRILTKAGYQVLTAADGRTALELFESHINEVSLALLDAVMPGLTGHEVHEQIKLSKPGLPVVFCTGYDPQMAQVKTLVEDGLRLVQKPYDPEVLLHAVRDALDARPQLELAACSH